jgi:hypothetical protein
MRLLLMARTEAQLDSKLLVLKDLNLVSLHSSE